MNVLIVADQVYKLYKTFMLKTSKYSSQELAMESIESEISDDLFVNNFDDAEILEVLSIEKGGKISTKTAYKFITFVVCKQCDCTTIDEFLKACVDNSDFNCISPISPEDIAQIKIALSDIIK